MTTPAVIIKVLTAYFRWLVAGVVVIILIVGYLTLLAPKLTDIRGSQVTAQKKAVGDLQAKQESVKLLQESNAKYDTVLPTARRQLIDSFIPSEADFPGLILTVKNIVSQSQLTLNSITVGQGGQVAVAGGAAAPVADSTKGGATGAQAATISGVNIKTQDVTISVSGGTSYEAFKNLLKNIEASQRLFDVVSVSFSSGTAAASGGTASSGSQPTSAVAAWSLVLRTYYLPAK